MSQRISITERFRQIAWISLATSLIGVFWELIFLRVGVKNPAYPYGGIFLTFTLAAAAPPILAHLTQALIDRIRK